MSSYRKIPNLLREKHYRHNGCEVKVGNFLGAFAELPKEPISFIMSVCLCLRIEQLRSYRTDFQKIWYWGIFPKSVGKIGVSLKSDKNNVCFTWKPTHIYYNISPYSS